LISEKREAFPLQVNWYGQACFLFEGEGVRLVTDPPAREVGYLLPESEVDPGAVLQPGQRR
jgi:L-ascorbate metabolism protein UlaG (beta-lactamase superfamily)